MAKLKLTMAVVIDTDWTGDPRHDVALSLAKFAIDIASGNVRMRDGHRGFAGYAASIDWRVDDQRPAPIVQAPG